MNHPNPEEWVPYLYGEAGPAKRQDLKAHLQSCPECRQEVEAWRRSMNRLDHWKVPSAERRPTGASLGLWRWATAAAAVLLAGVWIGRATAPRLDPQQVRAAITPELRRELSTEAVEAARAEAARVATLNLASSQKYTDQVAQQLYVALKRDVDTIAQNTDAGLRYTAQQLVQLADYSQPRTEPQNQ